MRLLSKSILYYLLISLPLLVIAGFMSYYMIREEVLDGADESLKREKQNAIHLIEHMHFSSAFYLSADSLSLIEPLSTALPDDCKKKDVKLFDRLEDEEEKFRVLYCNYNFERKTYRITIAKPAFEDDELVEGLLSSLLLIFGFLLLAFFIVNWLLSKKLWQPFYKTIQQLEAYQLTDHQALQPDKSNIYEFKKLNETLSRMTEKMYADYRQQKEFAENASHELQTPLAVINASLDNLFQLPHLKEEDLNELQSIERAVKKLSSLNKALLMLTKIENRQFSNTQRISINEVMAQLLEDYESIYASKNIHVIKDFKSEVGVTANSVLIDLLLGNLLKNAFRHNLQNGTLNVEIKDSSLSVSNPGEPLSISKHELFSRFKKNDSSSDSLGLGLAIVKSIVSSYGYSISYEYQNDQHRFVVNF